MKRCAILDDYQNVALSLADWSGLDGAMEVTSFNDHLVDEDAVAERLKDFEIVCLIRERTPITRSLLEKLPKLELLISSGFRNASVDSETARARGVKVAGTNLRANATPELTWALILGLLRQIPREDRNVREGRWQETVGVGLEGKTLGIIGLGRIGTRVAKVANAFDMNVLAWSRSLTAERCAEHGVTLATKEQLLSDSDIVTIHVVLSDASRGLIGKAELGLMKPTAYLINTSRGPIVDEAALADCLRAGGIRGAGIDVYSTEPLPAGDPARTLPNTVLTPHIGYVEEENYKLAFAEMVRNIQAFLNGEPVEDLR